MSLRNCLIVVWVYVVYVIGTYLFISGYLMSHFLVYQNASANVYFGSSISCKDFASLHNISYELIKNLEISSPEMKKSLLQRFEKAVILIIDALRYDFVINSSFVHGDEEFYLNKIPIVTKLVRKHPRNAVLLPLTADPPTTTLQRLKGITTGSLPTFIDISRNFASTEILEDNLIRQMKRMNRSIVFMGDDTWDGIFPNQFTGSFFYPSFNVKDLDTVDNGILDHIYEKLKENSTDVLIAHFLGVDHCGHRYGPKHPEMSRKLLQMNSVITKITNMLDNKTILLVLGDHGMTNTGDHGGDSTKETSTALFLYSPSKIIFDYNVHTLKPVSQIDIVPTLSLLLGLPIPFSNLGSIIPSLFALNYDQHCFNEDIDVLLGRALAAAENALQMHRYLKAYSSESREIDLSFIHSAERNLESISYLWKNITNNVTQNSELLSEIKNGYMEYTKTVYDLFRKKWTAFNVELMLLGLVVLCFAVFFNILCSEKIGYKYIVLASASIGFIFTLLMLYWFFPSYAFLPLTLIMFCIFVKISLHYKVCFTECILNILNAQSLVLLLLFLCSFSNSFIIYEDHIVLYLLQSVILYRFYPSVISFLKHLFQTGKTKSSKHNQKVKYTELVLLVCLMFCIRMGSLFFKCREEQINCVNTDFTLSLEKMHTLQSYKILRLFLSLASVIIPVIVFFCLLTYKSATKFPTATAMSMRYGIFFVCVFTSLRWWLNVVPPEAVEKILKGNEVMLTRAALFISVIMSTVFSISPILSEKPWTLPSREIYSESLGTFLFIILQIFYLIAGDAISSAVTLMSASLVIHIVLGDLSTYSNESQLWIDVLIWHLSSRYWFYASAHQAAFSTIQWDAAFLLNHKEINSYTLSGALVLLNTFSSNVLHGLAFPALLVWSQSTACSSTSIRRLHLKYIVCSGIKLAGHAIAAFILRRHLMAVQVFSPRLVYEVLGLFTTMISASIGHYLILTVISQYHTLIRKNLGHVFSDKSQ